MHIRDSRGSVFFLGGGVGQKKKISGGAGQGREQNPLGNSKTQGIFVPLLQQHAVKPPWSCEFMKRVGVFDSNVPLALLIDPWKFHVDALIGKTVCPAKPKQIWAKIGQIPYIRKIQSLSRAIANVLEGWFFHHFIRIEIPWWCAKKNHQDPTNCCRIIW